ncbi:hypothetical protein AAFF_G00150230 [Aldrovandia affinis]|uniref:Uncharacterized protein n=1 Tax=Aldrovandia affinis TaxID=143900 RepID=A0AAD7RP64_9TELE|nr:hypothetical protein AAFF_G00150230 [Aldrovandia affinis]
MSQQKAPGPWQSGGWCASYHSPGLLEPSPRSTHRQTPQGEFDIPQRAISNMAASSLRRLWSNTQPVFSVG